MKLDWNDLHIFNAVVDFGSTRRAAAALRIDQATCSRRVAALEKALGLPLFDRRPGGFIPTESGRRLAQVVKRMDDAAIQVERLVAQIGRERESVLRLSVGDVLVGPVVQPSLAEFRRRWPDVRIDLAVETRYVDILAGEADMAIRPGDLPDQSELVVRRLGPNPIGVYCHESFAERFGLPTTMAEHLDRPFACMEGRALELLTSHYPDRRPQFVASSLQPLIDAVCTGDFSAALPSLNARGIAGLIHCFPVPVDAGSVWLIYHPRLKAMRAARDLSSAIARQFQLWSSEGR